MKVLVTGGAGYIGSHTCKALHQSGHEPIVVDNLVNGHEWSVKWGPFHQLDIRETGKLSALLKEARPDAVVHFAAFAYVGESMREPEKYYDNNVVGSKSLFTAMQAAEMNKIVFSSTCATYGVPNSLPITEETPQNPINPYGETKLEVEKRLHDLCLQEGFSAIALRYFNAAGADPNLEIGEDHQPETHLIPLAIAAALGDGDPLQVFGNDYDTSDGTCIRDYIHVSDLAKAHVRALEVLGNRFQAYNLGTGRGASVKEVLDSVGKACGAPVPFEEGPRREGDPASLVANAEKAQSALSWTPEYDLGQITEHAVAWYRKHFKGESK